MLEYLDVLRLRELYWQGHWDEAARLADERVGREQRGPVRLLTVRSQIRLARGFCREALADTADALEGGRASVEPQQLHAALAAHARASLAAGARSAGLAAVDELLDRFVAEGTQQLSGTLPDLAVTAVDLGRADAFCRAIGTLKKQTPWVAAARSFAEGDFASAAAIYTEIGSRPDAAYAHLRAARALVEQGRVAEADPPLREALAFYRSVGATYYLREGEALLAATA
jgi:tetratricopeptide (TPR) repeat protein